MKKQLLFLALLSSLVISGCNQSKTSNSESSNSSTESTLTSSITSEETTTSGQGTTSTSSVPTSSTPSSSSNPSSTSTPSSSSSSSSSSDPVLPPPPVIVGSDIEEALKKDYSNMTAEFAISSLTEGEESGIEYYVGNHDFVAVLDSNAAVTTGYQRAWSFYCYYNNESYAYWDEQMHMQTTGWISKGSKGTKVGIDKAYFYMPYFLSVITEDDVEGVLGSYVVKESSLDKV